MNVQRCIAAAGLLAVSLAGTSALAHSAPPATPVCDELASDPRWGLAGNPAITGLTAVVMPAIRR